jgi:transposase
MVKRCGAKRARTAVARKLAVLLLRLWKQESHFEAQSAKGVTDRLAARGNIPFVG